MLNTCSLNYNGISYEQFPLTPDFIHLVYVKSPVALCLDIICTIVHSIREYRSTDYMAKLADATAYDSTYGLCLTVPIL